MRLLLDTNILVWLAENNKRLSSRVIDRIAESKDDLFVSIVSAWEYGQKRKLRPHDFADPFEAVIAKLPCIRLGLEFELHHFAESLPLIHRDPFDRMLIAQAIHHDLEFVTSDETIHRYPVRWFW